MRKGNYYFFALLVLCSLIWSCKKDDPSEIEQEENFSEIVTDFNQIIEYRTIPCIDIPELCPTPPYAVGPGPVPGPVPDPGGPSSRVIFKDGDLEYMVSALPSAEGTKSFMVETGEQQMVISDTQDELYTKFSDTEIEIPHCLYGVFNMNYQKWQEGSLSVEDISTSYEGRPVYNNTEEGYLVIEDDFLTGIDPDCPPPAKRIKDYWYCSYRSSGTTSAIINELMVGISQDVINSTRFTIRQAVEECAQQEPNCFTCIDQSCIHEKLRTRLGSNLTKKMRLRHLQLMLSYSDAQFQVLTDDHPEIIQQLLEAYNLKTIQSTCNEVCGSHCALAGQATLAIALVDVDAEMAESLCEKCTSTYGTPFHNCMKSLGDKEFWKDFLDDSEESKYELEKYACCYARIEDEYEVEYCSLPADLKHLIVSENSSICSLTKDEFVAEIEVQLFLNDEIYVPGEDYEGGNDLVDLCNISDCFDEPRDASTEYRISLIVHQPSPGNRDPWVWKDFEDCKVDPSRNIEFGHSYVNIETESDFPGNSNEGLGGNFRRVTFGFYPTGGRRPSNKNEATKITDGAVFSDAGRAKTTLGRTWKIEEDKFDMLIDNLEAFGCANSNPTTDLYHLDNYNCTDFAIEVANSIGLGVKETHGVWYNGGGSNCGDLAEDLRAMTTGTLFSGTTYQNRCD